MWADQPSALWIWTSSEKDRELFCGVGVFLNRLRLELVSRPRKVGLVGRDPRNYGVLRSRERAAITSVRLTCAALCSSAGQPAHDEEARVEKVSFAQI